jgi:hypothetical protein
MTAVPDGFPEDWQDELYGYVMTAAEGFADDRALHANMAVEVVSTWLGVPYEQRD